MDNSLSSENIKKQKKMFNTSFTICYLILFGTALITFIESMRTNNVHARHILNVETAVSLTAGFVYGWFKTFSESPDFNLKEIVLLRYIDWSITTPMLILVLLLFFKFHSKQPLKITVFLVIVLFNYLMLWFGYMGEKKEMEKRKAQTLGFLSFFIMLALIYYFFLHGHCKTIMFPPLILFMIFSFVWFNYGIAAELDDVKKNMMYNILDMISKVFFGLGLWLYYGGVTQI
jgi:bacteriorhodopsin